MDTRGRRGPKRLEEKHPEIIGLLGTVSTTQLADQYGVHPATIRAARKRVEGMTAADRTKASNPVPITMDPDAVIVIFRAELDGHGDPTVWMLNSHSGVRVFHRDHVDGRVTMGGDLPHFTDTTLAVAYLLAEPGEFRPCTVSLVSASRMFSGPWADYRPEVVPTCPTCGQEHHGGAA